MSLASFIKNLPIPSTQLAQSLIESPWFEKNGNIESWKNSEVFKSLNQRASAWQQINQSLSLNIQTQWEKIVAALEQRLSSKHLWMIDQIHQSVKQNTQDIYVFVFDQGAQTPVQLWFYQDQQQLQSDQKNHISAKNLGFEAYAFVQSWDEVSVQVQKPISALQSLLHRDGLRLDFQENAQEMTVHVFYALQHDLHPQFSSIEIAQNRHVVINEYFLSQSESVNQCALFDHQINIDSEGHLTHYRIQDEGKHHLQLTQIHTQIHADAHYELLNFQLGASQSRLEIVTQLLGKQSRCQLGGLCLGKDQQQMDLLLDIQHLSPYTFSAQQFKNIVTDQAKTIFTGKVLVAKGASACEAEQNNGNLMLNAQAKIYSRPQLEIYNHDVKCSHGATIAQIDEDALFYINARGLEMEVAQQFLTSAFAMEIAQKAPNSLIQNLVHQGIASLLKIDHDFSLDEDLFDDEIITEDKK